MSTPSSSHSERPPNRLIHETSPYLRQHAHNPVDWRPWDPEALQAARDLDRPIFLSIGYSACHWCHVMEHESFEDESIAALMNEHFVCIKVDREERPDLDQIYMNAVQLMTRRGGWPMSVFLTPELQPFFGGTYWPPESRMGMPGFRDILREVHKAWTTRRGDVAQTAHELTTHVRGIARMLGDSTDLGESLLRHGMQRLIEIADRRYGGFGGAPKFPHATDLRLLLRCWSRFSEADALAVARLTLDKMAAGGIYDHLGGGFHRYSTDERWLAPHFEKMLYDNALLVPAYLEAFQATGEQEYARVARETLDYVLREMTQPEGGFYSTQDADSEREEGKFFVWSEDEIDRLLGSEDARVFNYCYDVTPEGNWEGKTILNRPKTDAQAAKVLGVDEDELGRVLARCRKKLFDARAARIHPGRDEKVLVNWNGMMISAFAAGAQVLDDEHYLKAAQAAADFLLRTMHTENGGLLHSYKDGRPRFNAYLDDYACLIDGLIDVYQASFESRYLDDAVMLAAKMVALFHDDAKQGFFYTSSDHEELIARNKEAHDGSTPSGNGMAAWTLVRLARICGRADFEQTAVSTLEFLSSVLSQSPTAAGQALLALDFLLGPTCEIALVDGTNPGESREVLEALHRRFVPNKVVVRKSSSTTDDRLPATLGPLLKGKTARGDRATVYICDHGACGLPVVGVAGLEAALAR
ncbi:MAG TPA: thioredoxin domain-containing protein [Planctomycetaceae bacterium]|nr:thioredoxin domain-containing protein [Planctomycetaceae bacterium]